MPKRRPDFSQALFIKLAFIFILLVLLSACQVRSLPIFPMTITPTPTPAFTVTATETATLTETPIPTFTETVAITPTVTGPASTLAPDQPWLAYLTDENGLVVLNQDGSGQRQLVDTTFEDFRPLDCSFGKPFLEADSPVRAAIFPAVFPSQVAYFVRPPADMHILRSYEPYCHYVNFSVNKGSGLVAAIEGVNEDGAIPELIIYEMPGGKVRDRFSLTKCPNEKKCYLEGLGWWNLEWSPNGRYLAFPSNLGGGLKYLYLYDSQDHSVRQLTNGPERVTVLSWSPDGEWIIIAKTGPLQMYEWETTSVDAISPHSGQTHLLYSPPAKLSQRVLGWVDDTRFLVHDYDTPYAYNLRLVDLSGKMQVLFKDTFGVIRFDSLQKIVSLYALGDSESLSGTYLISMEDLSLKFIDRNQYWWRDDLGLFVTDDSNLCPDDFKKIQTLTSDGKVQCIDQPAPIKPIAPENFPSPDGQWQVVARDGQLQLQAPDQTLTQVTKASVTQVIWCQDSTCFFFVADQVLYRVSVPDLTLQQIHGNLKKDEIIYQWLNARN